MDPHQEAQYSSTVLDEAVDRFGIEPASVHTLEGFESFLFECVVDQQPRILRISHSERRTAHEIAGELDFVNYLANHDVSVCEPHPSRDGHLLEVLGSDNVFIASLFRKAPGQTAENEVFQPELFKNMGAMMGRMHALSVAYAPTDPSARRPSWRDELSGIAERHLPTDQSLIAEEWRRLLSATQALPQGSADFGLIHADFHRGNFFVDDSRIHLFDFDDCQFSWFADDIAIALFYAAPHDCSSPKELDFARTFLGCFLDGYRRHRDVQSDWLERLPMFLKRREIHLYILIYRSFLNKSSGSAKNEFAGLPAWPASFMRQRRQRIESGTPYVDIDFRGF